MEIVKKMDVYLNLFIKNECLWFFFPILYNIKSADNNNYNNNNDNNNLLYGLDL